MQWRNTWYREDRYGTPVESFGIQRAEANRVLYCRWANRSQAKTDFLGYTTYVKDDQNAYAYPSRITPNYHPKFLAKRFRSSGISWPYLFCDNIQFEPFLVAVPGRDPSDPDIFGATVANFQEARMHVHYGSPPFTILTDEQLSLFLPLSGSTVTPSGGAAALAAPDESSLLRYVFARQTFVSKYQTVPTHHVLKWSLDGEAISLENVIQLCEADITIRWFDIPQYFWSILATQYADTNTVQASGTALIGCTNQFAFGNVNCPVGSFPPKTLVFLTPDVEPFPRGTGEMSVNVTYRMRYYPFGANKAYRVNEPKNLSATRGQETWRGPGYYGFNTGGGDATTAAWPAADGIKAFPDDVCPDAARLYKTKDFANAFRVAAAKLP